MPEPLNKVLEPVSVQNLDMPEEEEIEGSRLGSKYRKQGLTRHGSVGAVEDPGVIGPIVWNMHCQRLQHGKIKIQISLKRSKLGFNISFKSCTKYNRNPYYLI